MEEINYSGVAETVGRIYGVYAYATEVFNAANDSHYIAIQRFTTKPFSRLQENIQAFEVALGNLERNRTSEVMAAQLRQRLDELFAATGGRLPTGRVSQDYLQFWYGLSVERTALRQKFGEDGRRSPVSE